MQQQVKVVRKVSNKKEWNPNILSTGGVSYFYPKSKDTDKQVYRVALCKDDCTTKLKYKIKTANGDIFSVAASSQGDAKVVVDEIYGKGKYRVSEMLV